MNQEQSVGSHNDASPEQQGPSLARWGVGSGSAVVGLWVINMIADAVFGESVSWLAPRAWKRIAKAEFPENLGQILVVTLVVFILTSILWGWLHRRDLRLVDEELAQIADQVNDIRERIREDTSFFRAVVGLVSLDDSLMRMLPALAREPDPSKVIKPLILKMLREATRIFGNDVSRVSLWLPDGECLKVWMSDKLEHDPSREYYIGSDPSRLRGMAGEAFATRTLNRVHLLLDDDGRWVADSPHFISSNSDRPHPPFVSLVSVPLLHDDGCIGVVCFDSPHLSTFDNLDDQFVLWRLGTRIAATILLYEPLAENPPNTT